MQHQPYLPMTIYKQIIISLITYTIHNEYIIMLIHTIPINLLYYKHFTELKDSQIIHNYKYPSSCINTHIAYTYAIIH